MIVAKMHIKYGSNAYIRNRNTFDAELKPFQIRLMFTGCLPIFLRPDADRADSLLA